MIELFDMHSHILPGVDDGSPNMEVTRQMLQIAYEQGIRHMVATPHFIPGGDNEPVEKLIKTCRAVQKEASLIGEDFHIYLGNELYYYPGICDFLDSKEALTINNSRYTLMEFNVTESFDVIYGAFEEMIRRGYLPIVAHVERYHNVVKKIENIEELIRLGVLIQVNISSLNGGFMDPTAAFTKKLLKYDMIHLFGTDAHRAIGRAPFMQEGVAYIEKKYGAGTVKLLLNKNPKKILKNQLL